MIREGGAREVSATCRGRQRDEQKYIESISIFSVGKLLAHDVELSRGEAFLEDHSHVVRMTSVSGDVVPLLNHSVNTVSDGISEIDVNINVAEFGSLHLFVVG